jgi:hypothetical protein
VCRLLLFTEFIKPQFDNWNLTYGLQLFSDYVLPIFGVANAPDEVFAGAIHLVKLYNYALPKDDAFILHQASFCRQRWKRWF